MVKNSLLIIMTIMLLGAGLRLLYLPQQATSIELTSTPPLNAEEKVLKAAASQRPGLMVSTPSVHDQLVAAQSLRGTHIDGALTAGSNGQLILDQGVRDFFDYFLSTADEIGPENAISEIRRYIEQYLPRLAAEHAQQLLSKFLQYKHYELQVQQQPLDSSQLTDMGTLEVLRNSFDGFKAKRAELFSVDEHQALFGLEQVYQSYTLETLEAFADVSLSDEQRQAKLNELTNSLPVDLQASRAEDVQIRQQQAQHQGLAAQQVDDTQYHQALIEQGSSQKKADELVSYRQHQQQFEERYRQYRTSVKQLDVDGARYEQDVAQLRQRFFLQPEERTKAKLRDLNEPSS